MQVVSRFNSKIPFFLIAGLSFSYVFSLFLLQFFAALLFLFWITEKNSEKRKAVDTLTYIIIAFGVVRVLSIVFSEYPASSNESFYKEAIFYLSFISLNFYLKTFNDKQISDTLLIFILSAAINSVIAIGKFNFSVDERAQSLSSGYAAFSSYILAVMGLAFFYRKNIGEKYNSYLWILILSLLITAVITSLGRTNILLAVLVFFFAVLLKQLDLKIILTTVIISTLISIISFYNNESTTLQNRLESPAHLSDRDIIFKGAEKLAFEKPLLGFGPRTFHDIFPYKSDFADKGIGSWHNDFIQIYFETGVAGLLVFLVLIFYVFFVLTKVLREKEVSKENKKIAAGLFAAIFLMVVSGLTAGFITSPVLSVLFVFLITFASSIKEISLIKEKS